jgi:hypothetical protein
MANEFNLIIMFRSFGLGLGLGNSFKCSEHFIRRRISPSFKNGIIRLEAGAFKFLRNQLFMMLMQLPQKMSRSLL